MLIRRNDHAARIELLPLIDVVFLLLTFFIFSMMVMVRLEALSVELAPLTGQKQLTPSQVETLTVTIDRRGRLHLADEQVSAQDLVSRIVPRAEGIEAPILFIAMSDRAEVDRAPIVLDLMKRLVGADFSRYTFVGPPAPTVMP